MKFSNNEILKLRTRSTIEVTLNILKNIPTEELISDLFVHSDDDINKELIKRFEGMLIKGKLDPDYMIKNLHLFFIKTNSFLKKNNLYKEFAEFSFLIYNSLKGKNIDNFALSCYLNLLLQQYTYISKPGYLIYGVDKSGNPMLMKEFYPLIDTIFYELEKIKRPDKDYLLNRFKSLGYKVNNNYEVEVLMRNEHIINNMILTMVNFINEDNLDLIPKNYFMPSKGFKEIRIWKGSEFYKDNLTRRRYILPQAGVLGEYKNAGDVKNILFKEYVENNVVYMLYKLTNIYDKSIYGVYDTKNKGFYSIYSSSDAESEFGTIIENFVLESYAHLTCDIGIDKKRNLALKEVDSLDEDHFPHQPIVNFLHNTKNGSRDKSSKGRSRTFDKKKYKETGIDINPFIRKLPVAATPSEEAIERAREFGYELQDGETFVRGFSKKSYTLKV